MKKFRKHIEHKLLSEKFNDLFNVEKELQQLAIRILQTRNNLGLTQKELADRAKITQQQLSKVEKGINCNLITFLKVCNALEMKLTVE